MSDIDYRAPICDDMLPLYSQVGVESVPEVPLYSPVGEAATPIIPVHSTIGVGPKGEKGDPGVPGADGANGVDGVDGTVPIEVVPAASWPPANPVDGILYLKGE